GGGRCREPLGPHRRVAFRRQAARHDRRGRAKHRRGARRRARPHAQCHRSLPDAAPPRVPVMAAPWRMRAPSFWWRKAGFAATWRAPAGALYGAVAAGRMRQPGRDIGVPVVCVGDLTLGGAGKTPLALALGRLIAAAGRRPFFLSRGYGGASAGPIAVQPARHTAQQVGDEPLLLARVAPTIVARDRAAGATAAQAARADVIVMGDGLHSPRFAEH